MRLRRIGNKKGKRGRLFFCPPALNPESDFRQVAQFRLSSAASKGDAIRVVQLA
ncbi:hypothetical protein RMSM_05070 [Rhodopirellula maiorica SM1]|uniref:Uncharacterized protein n=1 Tax=Rhodopirellula maiorica SM1 TaxID=1265738 RepID=M5REV7_9BACT|nr:hypothetical protein RMSM_05070 [Rhodopirellula maiorica SM1]